MISVRMLVYCENADYTNLSCSCVCFDKANYILLLALKGQPAILYLYYCSLALVVVLSIVSRMGMSLSDPVIKSK